MVEIVGTELILGGQRSGKSRRAEWLTQQWLSRETRHDAIMVATAQAWDAEMHRRIERHQADRAQQVPRMRTVETPTEIAAAIRQHSHADTLIVVDCLTLWLTNLLMPAAPENAMDEADVHLATEALVDALASAPGPVVLVSNEIGLGVIPMGREVRTFVDAQGQLNQRLAQMVERVTLMAAGLPLTLKGSA